MKLEKRDFDAIVVGSGPNGLAAAILLQQKGLSVLWLEGKPTSGGGLRCAELTLPGYSHDRCSAVHPVAVASPFFSQLPLHDHGLEYLYPETPVAHPLDDGTAAIIRGAVEQTAQLLGDDRVAYEKLMSPIVKDWPFIAPDVLGPLHYPKHPMAMARFGLKALTPASYLIKRFNTTEAKALFAGAVAHAIQPLTNTATSAIGLVLIASAHLQGWPIPKGGSDHIANALASYFKLIGGTIETNM